jgi:enoyl-CoA hydratase/carnithine racemase
MLDAREALALGVVSEVVEPEQLMPRVREMAAGIAGGPWAAMETKRRALLDAERSWLPLLDEEGRVLRQSLLGPAG